MPKELSEVMKSFKKSPNKNGNSLFGSQVGLDTVKDTLMLLLEEHPIAYRASFGRIFGGPRAGVFLSQLFFWTGKEADDEGWIWKSQEEWEEETGMNVNTQRTARRQLKKHGVLLEKTDRIKHEVWYKLDKEVFIEKLCSYFVSKQAKGARDSISVFREVGKSDFGKSESPISILDTETTAKITTETTKKAAPNGTASKKPLPFQILAEGWCEFVKIDINDLTDKDWKAIHQHDKKGADIEQLKALSGAAWKEKKHDLTTLYHQRASLLPKIKPVNQKTFFTPEEVDAMEAAND